VLRGAPSLDKEMMDPGRLLRLGGGQSDPGNPTSRRRRSVRTVFHVVLLSGG
jgi:hypothetical protein